jgi:hypothetical protein
MTPSLKAPLLRTGPVPTFETVDLPSSEDRQKRIRYSGVSPDDGHVLAWISLNPSGKKPGGGGPTGKRIFEFAWRWGFDAVTVYNLFPIETPNPKQLAALLADRDDLITQNCAFIAEELRGTNEVIVAWGNPPRSLRRLVSKVVTELVNQAHRTSSSANELSMWCLGRTKGGHPRHPSPLGQVPMSTLPQLWKLN